MATAADKSSRRRGEHCLPDDERYQRANDDGCVQNIPKVATVGAAMQNDT